ncbi:hypothetical protein UlMin_010845 [Ulmus minor]
MSSVHWVTCQHVSIYYWAICPLLIRPNQATCCLMIGPHNPYFFSCARNNKTNKKKNLFKLKWAEFSFVNQIQSALLRPELSNADSKKRNKLRKWVLQFRIHLGFETKQEKLYIYAKILKVLLISSGLKKPAYKNRLRALELECSGGSTNKKRIFHGKKKEEDLSQEFELQIKGAAKPSLWELVGVHFILLPCTIANLLLWYGHWSWRYKVKKAPYSWEDASYLTQRALRVPLDAWSNTGKTRKEDLVQRCLWVQSNLENYMAEVRKKSKRMR